MDAAGFSTLMAGKTYAERLQAIADISDALRALRQIVTDVEATEKFVTASGATWTTPTKAAFTGGLSAEPATQAAPTIYSVAGDFFTVVESI